MNRKEIYRKGYTYTITRRIIQTRTATKLRVRVVANEGFTGPEVRNEFKDYAHLAEGDAAFFRIIAQIEDHRVLATNRAG